MSNLTRDQILAEHFVRACLVSQWNPEQMATAGEVCKDPLFNWDAVRSMAHEERIAPLLYLATRDASYVPEALRHEFHSVYIETALENTLRLEEFSAIATCFTAQSVPILALKGLALLEPVYRNVALRPMVDLDILVHRNDVLSSINLLKGMGYEPLGPELAPQTTLTFENELLLRKRDAIEWHVELHWSLFDSPYYQRTIPETDLWDAMQTDMISGRACNVLSTEHQVLHLSGHLVLHHGGNGLLWWNDIAELIHRKGNELDWNRLIALAGTYDLRLSAKTVLFTLVSEWGVLIPSGIFEDLAASVPTIGEQATFRRLTAPDRVPARRLIDDLAGLGRWTDRARFLGHNLFPSSAYMDERYGIRSPMLRPFYYVHRWLRGVASLFGVTSNADPMHVESQASGGGDRG